MASKTFLLLALAFAVVLLVSSQIAAAKDLDESEVEDAKYGRDDRGYYNGGGRGGYNGGGRGGYNNGGGRGGYNNGGGRGGYNHGGGRGRGYCRYGCCGGGRYYNGGCRCCSTLAEATAYKQAHEAQTHN
ncbi:abscisic acid and environmental stress-inducible protein-like [Cynara cardunculus var. scolymus]|uniref:Glycine rich protein n=1 Tax=Cynara cardunculus var. scolymus TaxID=59895 RepID=A0A103YKD2_CYNCS|nr:abscisic acid and environmental stress-inducible protein-like [Cynara cardunculus var. scolymus]KVI10658.1 Glycine rich protein [Cynara cardunculus var. scolymus]